MSDFDEELLGLVEDQPSKKRSKKAGSSSKNHGSTAKKRKRQASGCVLSLSLAL